MTDSLEHGFKLPPEQQAIRDKCFHRSGTFVEFPVEDVETSIPERFEQMVRLYPDQLAVKMGDRALTFEELNGATNRIAHAILEKRGPGSEPIALLFEHGIDVIAAIFGVLKAGKFFIALNPAFPEPRNLRALEDSGAPLIVTNYRHKALVESLGRGFFPSLEIETLGENYPRDPVFHHPAGDIAVLTYTSGSTGEPKGVVQTHQHLLHSFRIQTDEMRITIHDRVSLLHSLSFATAYSNLMAALLNGAALFPLDLKAVASGELTRWVGDQNITVLHLPPTSFRQFAESIGAKEQLHQLRLIRLSGAPITQGDFDLYKSRFPAGTLLNITMGSTEVRGICSAVLDQTFSFPAEGAPVGYGRPGKQILILDDLGREVENGCVGEIAVRSKYVDAEYWDPSMRDKALTQRTTEMDQDLIHLTGDLGKKLDDGFVIHLGRKDFMVKIRGYRVELGEIERALLTHPEVKDAGVVAWDQEPGEKYLVAYVVPRESNALTVNELRGFLKEKLPDYMIPAIFMFLDSLPLTNGKLDRTALPRPDHKRPNLQQPYAPPQDEVETRLVQIWEEILNVRPIGIHDNFFDLGGHSLAATRVISRLIQTFQLELPVKALFDAPTVAEMAAIITENQAKRASDSELAQMLREVETMSEEEAQKLLAGESARGSTGDGHE
jgi:amino acid adenylation domain-containing protein